MNPSVEKMKQIIQSNRAGTRHFPLFRLLVALVLGINLETSTWAESRSRAMTLRELVGSADLVAIGRIKSKSVDRTQDIPIRTTIEVDVEDFWKGLETSEKCLTFSLPGGVLGERKVVLTGQPEFGLGERCVVFLKRSATRQWVLVGFNQGKIPVLSSAENLEGWVNPPPMELSSANPIEQPRAISIAGLKKQVVAIHLSSP